MKRAAGRGAAAVFIALSAAGCTESISTAERPRLLPLEAARAANIEAVDYLELTDSQRFAPATWIVEACVAGRCLRAESDAGRID